VLHQHAALRPAAIAGSSIGAVNAAVIVGSPIDMRVPHLNELWKLHANLAPFATPDALAP
jgi:predicted acylesterase/phospholipase RssA